MDKVSSSLVNFFAYAPVCFLAVLCLGNGVAEAQEKSYSDCAYIEFDDVDPSSLTLQERIALEEAALFASLDDSAECMEEATASASGSLADAASGSGSGAAGGVSGSAGSSGNSEANSSEQQQSASTAPESAVETKDHQRGNTGSGSSAVCDAVKEGMASATTEAEKEHFKGLMAEYGC
ncbi:hypothetical protein U0358_11155 [Idiomarina sp. PL1-037]|uniref:hypothetical protein n=1 Tax=Idiomarina sp. PL1-037 TaxID=3095365 RepID=UPI002ACC0E79|nr:hypothetical protein [Idiomarina sp. PL1-037]WQC52589.1 hypothetical protein U0358_11155 [Idiomarina sp. PL1-037]